MENFLILDRLNKKQQRREQLRLKRQQQRINELKQKQLDLEIKANQQQQQTANYLLNNTLNSNSTLLGSDDARFLTTRNIFNSSSYDQQSMLNLSSSLASISFQQPQSTLCQSIQMPPFQIKCYYQPSQLVKFNLSPSSNLSMRQSSTQNINQSLLFDLAKNTTNSVNSNFLNINEELSSNRNDSINSSSTWSNQITNYVGFIFKLRFFYSLIKNICIFKVPILDIM